MSAPSILYTWGVTAVVAPTSGHQTNGYANDEVPGSSEWNTRDNNWSQWLTYLSGATPASITELVPLAGASPSLGSPVYTASGSVRYLSDPSNSWTVAIPINIEAGWTLTDVTFEFSSTAAHEGAAVLAAVGMTGSTTTLSICGETSTHTGVRTYSMSVVNAGTTQTLLVPTLIDGTAAIELLCGPFGAGDKLTGVKLTKTR